MKKCNNTGMTPTFKMVYLALLVAFAVAVHTVEAAIPVPIPVPGAKLGLANIITLFALVLYGYRSGLVVASLRSIIGSLLTGTFMGFGFYLSFSGAVLSCLAMALFMNLYKRRKISLISVSMAGAVTFNVVQLALASFLVQNLSCSGDTCLFYSFWQFPRVYSRVWPRFILKKLQSVLVCS